MLSSLLNVTALLLMAGIGIYVVVCNRLLRHSVRLQRALLGVVMGGVSALMMMSDPFALDVWHLALEGGPLIVAGFMGGLIGVLTAGAVSAIPHVLDGVSIVGMLCNLAMLCVGAAFGWALFRTRCVDYPPRAILGLIVLSIACLPVLSLAVPGVPTAETMSLTLAVMGISTALTALVCAAAMRHARQFRQLATFDEHMALAAEVAQIGTWDWYIAEDRCVWDEGMHALYGTDPTRKDLTSQDFLELVHPEDRQRLHRSSEAEALGGAPSQTEFRILRGDGQMRMIRSALVNRHDGKGRLVRVAGIHVDVTDLRTAEERLGAANSRLQTVIENVPGALISQRIYPDDQLTIHFLNPHCEQLFEISSAEVSRNKRALLALIHPDDRKALDRAIERSRRSDGTFQHRWRMNLPSGKEIWVEGHGTSRPQEDGSVIIYAFIVDISEIVRTEAELIGQRERAARAERLESIGKLSGGIAHDFNNLLAIIVGNLEILKEEMTGQPERLGYVRASLDAAVRGADLVRNMLSFARRAPLEPGRQDVPDLLNRVENWVTRVLPATIKVTMDTSRQTRPILADASGAENALVNLILNARDAMPEGGALSITARDETVRSATDADCREGLSPLAPGDYVVIEVRDTGHGITDQDASRIFEPFYTTRSPGQTSGSGLGLSTVHGFIQQTGGAIRLSSVPGKGTVIALYFPAVQDRPVPKVEQADKRAGGASSGVRILLAEDEPQVAKVLTRALTLAGHDVVAVPSGDAAESAFHAQGPFDILVTDIVMPGSLQGPDLAARLRETEVSLPVVFLSGYAPDNPALSRGIRPGDPRLMKPVVQQDLFAAITRALSRNTDRTAAE